MIAGDFNLIYKSDDKNNTNLNRPMMNRFRNTINNLALREIQLHGRKFTWSNQQDSPVLVKLDRVFWQLTGKLSILMFSCKALPHKTQIIVPCCLDWEIFLGKKRFHFEAFWTRMEGFQDVIQQVWNSAEESGCPFLSLDRKLREIAKQLQRWSQKKVGNVTS